MSQRFIRCPHCGLPHAANSATCPLTGAAIERRRQGASLFPPGTSPALSGAPAAPSPPPPAVRLASSSPPSRPASSSPPGEPARGAPPGTSDTPTGPASSSPPSGGPALVTDRRQLVGTVVGGTYLVKSLIGRGGMATVYEAEHLALGRTVALKVLPIEHGRSDEARKRFLQEARAAASIAHPNICQVYDFGTLRGQTLYFAMERLSGEPLSARIARTGGLPLVELLDILLQALAGLGAAHRKGILHRDFKPENVFLVLDDERSLVKLLDFGLVKFVAGAGLGGAEGGEAGSDEATQLTRTGIVMGTPFYMAPEQVTGDRSLDARVDLWAVGVVMYEASCGRVPFRGNNWAETINAILHEQPRPPRELRPGIPPAFERALDRALAKHRDARYGSAAEMGADLLKLRTVLASERRE
jgi:eukaryotic-like serine/threonine-protein kinase